MVLFAFLLLCVQHGYSHSFSDCPTRYTYNVDVGRHVGGQPIATPHYPTFNQCLMACNGFPWCNVVERDLLAGTCRFYDKPGVIVKDNCCMVGVKRCVTKQHVVHESFNTTGSETEDDEDNTGSDGGNGGNVLNPTKTPSIFNLPTTTKPYLGPSEVEATTPVSVEMPSPVFRTIAELLMEYQRRQNQGAREAQEEEEEYKPKTTIASHYPSFAIPDSGMCPDPLQKITQTHIPGGRLEFSMSEEACKQLCLDDVTCEGVDFNLRHKICIVHDEADMTSYARQRHTCCNHYHKTQCVPKMCFTHETLEMTDEYKPWLENVYLANGKVPGEVEAVECHGDCYVQETLELTHNATSLESRILRRGCIEYGQTQRQCSLEEDILDDGNVTFTLKCKCGFDRCNALSQATLSGLVVYLSLDGHTNDASSYSHHARSSGVRYDSYVAKKNMSAFFNGGSYLQIRSLIGYLPGYMSRLDRERTPSLTMTLWFRRLGDTDDVMTILSNGVLEIWSEVIEGDMYVYASVMLIDKVGYTVMGKASKNDWVFVSARVIFGETEETAELQLFLHEYELAGDLPAASLEMPADPILQSAYPLYIGRHPQQGNFFYGFIDEVFIFSDALESTALLAIHDLSRQL